jgi:hypothetical protein
VVGTKDLRTMVSLLVRALKARGFAALGGAEQRLTVPAPGTLTEQIYARVGATAARATASRRVVLASGRRVFKTAGRGALALRLTAAGRRAIRRAKRLRVQIVAAFAPTAGKRVSFITAALATKRKQRPGQAPGQVPRAFAAWLRTTAQAR